MAIFGIGKKKEKATTSHGDVRPLATNKERASSTPEASREAPKRAPREKSTSRTVDAGSILLRPRITEKATNATHMGVYVFEISPRAGKRDVMEAIRALYHVIPRRVNIVHLPQKRVASSARRGFPGKTAAIKKAYVYLRAGEKIELA